MGLFGGLYHWMSGSSSSPGSSTYDPITGGWGHTGLDPVYSAASSGPWNIDYGIASAIPFWGWGTSYYSALSYGGGYAPPSPPPPPPPPQDIYAGPNPAAAPTAPRWMRTAPYITQTAHDVTNPSSLLQHGPHIIEQPQPQATGPIAGLTELPTASAKPFTDNNTLSQQPLTSVGTPAAPSAELPDQPQPPPHQDQSAPPSPQPQHPPPLPALAAAAADHPGNYASPSPNPSLTLAVRRSKIWLTAVPPRVYHK